MISFRSPATDYESIDDAGRFSMVWEVSLVLIPIFLFLATLHVIMGDPSWVTSLLGLCVGVFNLIVLYRTRKYKLIAVTSVIFGTLICQAAIFLVSDSRLIADTMWCILVGFFGFFMLGSRIGLLTLLLNLAGLVIFLLNGSTEDIFEKGISIDEVDYRMVINVFYVALAMGYVIHKMILTNQETNRRYEAESHLNEVLFKEVHHRVKNNLQIISSLLRLQAAESNNPKVAEHFDEAIGRIRSMALIHEKMYNNDDLSKIDLKSYLISMSEDICSSIYSEGNLELNVESTIDQIDIKSMVPVSLIFNELMTNSMKHGFQGKKDARIDVQILQKGDAVHFVYQDNGTWIEPDKEGSFGLDLINTLTEQLEGEFDCDRHNGTRYSFRFNSDILFFDEE